MSDDLLVVEDLVVHFTDGRSIIRAVDGVSFSVQPGEIVGLVGESGCGKTVTTQSIMRLLPSNGGIVGGDIRLRGRSLLSLSNEEMRAVRGKRISIVVQDALAALNPVISIGEQIIDVLDAHSDGTRHDHEVRAIELLRAVGMPDPARRARGYAHELSGGMQQRVIIAAALACGPELIIADEPTTALDLTVQQQILALMSSARAETGAAILYISHDLATVSSFCDRVLIMYAGQIVEEAATADLFRDPEHPYTRGLMASIPPIGGDPPDVLPAIKGMPPDPKGATIGCRFADRCPEVLPECVLAAPNLEKKTSGRTVRCILYEAERQRPTPHQQPRVADPTSRLSGAAARSIRPEDPEVDDGAG